MRGRPAFLSDFCEFIAKITEQKGQQQAEYAHPDEGVLPKLHWEQTDQRIRKEEKPAVPAEKDAVEVCEQRVKLTKQKLRSRQSRRS